jgi:hypothetical protein
LFLFSPQSIIFATLGGYICTALTKHLANSQRALTDTLPQQPWRAEEFFFGDTE